MIEQNKLPNKYLVKVDKYHPLWNKFADYINRLEKAKLAFNCNYYGQECSEVVIYNNVIPDYKLLTLEEWDSIVNPKFILPKKWCCKPKNETEGIIIREWFNTYREYRRGSEDEFYWHYPAYEKENDRSHYCNTFKEPSYTKITFDQFKEHVLNKTNNNMNNTENQEIIGYKLVKPEYEEAACKIIGCGDLKLYPNGTSIGYEVPASCKLKKAGVLDLWFTPVYKVRYELPEINGYQGKLQDGFIIYGNNCAKFSTQFFIDLLTVYSNQNRKIKSITLDSGVVITIDQIKQIVDYINNNK